MQPSNTRKKVAHYKLLDPLGKGGMGEVFLAKDEILERTVAIKLLKIDKQTNADMRSRFMNEARVAASLNHPNIVTVYEFGEEADDQTGASLLYLVMEHLEGQSLSDILDARRLSPHESVIYAIQFAEGLQAAHSNGILHRDIKPSNIFITIHSRVKVLDFGLSKLLDPDSSSSSWRTKQTTDGIIVGTVPYLSPERAFGEQIDARSDIFSFGIVLYEMLTDRHPFSGNNETETLARITSRGPHPWPETLNIPTLLKTIVARCLQKDPKARYPNIGQMIAELESVKRELQSTGRNLKAPTERVERHDSPPTMEFVEQPPTERVVQTKVEDTPELVVSVEPEVEPAVASEPIVPLAEAHTITDQKRLAAINPQRRSSRSYLAKISAVVIAMIGIALIGYFYQHYSRDIANQLKSIQITASAGLDIYPSFSLDGSSIVYSSDRSGSFEIYIKQLTPGGREIQLTKDGEQNLQPAWSPNGELIAYYAKKRGGIWVMPALGGVPRQVSETGSRPAWSPDGQYLTFQSDPLIDFAAGASVALPPSTIWLTPVAGGPVKQLTKSGTPIGGHGSPTFSADGQRIVFVSSDRVSSAIWSIALDGSDLKRVVTNQHFNYDPICSPDGHYLYYFAISQNWDYGMWRLTLDAQGEPQGEPTQIANLGLDALRQLAISRDGKKIAYSAISTSSNLHSVALLPELTAAGKPRPLTNETDRNSRPAFSPDGSQIAFDKWRLGNNPDIWIMDNSGNNPSQLTTNSAMDTLPSWLPGGNEIAYLSNRNNRWALWKVVLNSGKEGILSSFDQDIEFGRLSPDGQTFAFNSKKNDTTINTWLNKSYSSTSKQLTFDKEMVGFPCWSPDSKYLAVQIKRGEDRQIGIVDIASGNIEQLTKSAGQSWSDSWSPDGDKIAFAGMRNGFWEIWWISRTTKAEQKLTSYEKLSSYVRYPSWSPKGDQIVYEYAETSGNIWLIDNLK